MRVLRIASMAVAAAMMSFGAAQATMMYDTSLADPPGVYFGSGNPNMHWTVYTDSTNGVEMGLLGLKRYLAAYTPMPGTSTYMVDGGPTMVSGKTGAAWDFAFSLSLMGGSYTLGDVTSQLCLTDHVQGTGPTCFDPLLIPDNALNSDKGAQNSETLSFAGIAAALGDPGYNMWIADTYDFTWTLYDKNTGANLGMVAATFKTVPEPSTIALLAAALGLMGFWAWRRRKAKGAI